MTKRAYEACGVNVEAHSAVLMPDAQRAQEILADIAHLQA